MDIDYWRKGVELERALVLRNGAISFPQRSEHGPPEPLMGCSIVGIQFNCALEFASRAVNVQIGVQYECERRVRLGEALVDLQRFDGGLARLSPRFSRIRQIPLN